MPLIELWSCRGKISMQENSMICRPCQTNLLLKSGSDYKMLALKWPKHTNVWHWELSLAPDNDL